MPSVVRSAGRTDILAIGSIAESSGLFPADLAGELISSALQGVQGFWLVIEKEGAVAGFALCEPERMTDRTRNMRALSVAYCRWIRPAVLNKFLLARSTQPVAFGMWPQFQTSSPTGRTS